LPKPPSWNQIRANAAAFAARWVGETSERAEAQTFWNEFLAIFGIDRRRVAYFEQEARRTSTGHRGQIDLFWPGTLIAEHKSADKDLDAAEGQALDYLGAIPPEIFPEVVLTSDFAHIRILDLGGENQPFTFPLGNLVKEIDRFGFIAGYAKRDFSPEAERQADVEAARLMARLYEELSKEGYGGHDASVLLTRILFLVFGDDTGMWEKDLFTEFLETRTQSDGTDCGPQLAHLFQTLDTPEDRRPASLDDLLRRFPFVDGELFRERIHIPSFDHNMRAELLKCGRFDWGGISPAVFGSMFQSVYSMEARRHLGEHYTTEQNILKVVGPLFLDDLRAEFDRIRDDAPRLRRLRQRLGQLRFLDPACGCGNFLVVAYREMRRLELQILKRLRDLTDDHQLSLDVTMALQVRLDQFYGIELEEWPLRIAETAMFLVDRQENLALAHEFGQAPDRLPIVIASTFYLGNAVRTSWAELLAPSDNVLVFGNPPFVGMSLMSAEQQADNRIAFGAFPGEGMRTGRLDYVACWYAKAIAFMRGTRARAAFVSTSSITQGEQPRALQPFLLSNGFRIDFAHRTFKWTSELPETAAVHVVIIGFSEGGQAKKKRLFDYPDIEGQPIYSIAENINFYLVDGDDITPVRRSVPLLAGLPIATQGSKPWDNGHLIVEAGDYEAVVSDQHAAKYVRPLRGARELLYGLDRWCLWLVGADPGDILASPILRQRLDGVRTFRAASRTASVRAKAATPALFSEDRQPTVRFLALPQTSSENRHYIPGTYYEPDVIVTNGIFMWPSAPLWLFGYLQSGAFMAWVRTFSGRLESRLQIAPSTVYFTFPFIQPTPSMVRRIESLAASVLSVRAAYPDASLAALYNPDGMPQELRRAHNSLDATIDGLYGLKRPTEGQRLRVLLRRYGELSAPLIPGMARPRTTTLGRLRQRARGSERP
jgi:hypothetical protein